MSEEKKHEHEEHEYRAEPETTVEPAVEAVAELPEIPHEPQAPESVRIKAASGEQHSRRSGWKLFAAAVALVAVGAGVGSGTTWYMARKYAPFVPLTVQQSAELKRVAETTLGSSNVIPEVYRQVGAAVVSIKVEVTRGFSRGQSSGSGFIVDPRGYILTNNHVIEGAQKISVHFVDGSVLAGTVVGNDKFKDLAVVKVDPGTQNLVVAPLGDSDQVQVGELAIAIGSPFSQDQSVTAGIVSGLNRDLREENAYWVIPGAIQTDAAINPGNSGGPLLNSNGEVIGINTAIESPTRGSVGIGFAVPVNAAKEILPTLISGQKVQYAWMGVSMQDMTPAIAKEIGTTVTEGVLIYDVMADSPAEKAGIRPVATTRRGVIVAADIIIDIDGRAIKKSDDIGKYISSKKPGDVISVTFMRGTERLTISVTLASRPDSLPKDDE